MVQQDFSTGFVLCVYLMTLVASCGSQRGEPKMLLYYDYNIVNNKLWGNDCIGIVLNLICDVSWSGVQTQSG